MMQVTSVTVFILYNIGMAPPR